MSNSADDVFRSFWTRARAAMPALPVEQPEAWAFGATPEHADELLKLVLAGTKTATASSLWDYEATGEPVPQPGAVMNGKRHGDTHAETAGQC